MEADSSSTWKVIPVFPRLCPKCSTRCLSSAHHDRYQARDAHVFNYEDMESSGSLCETTVGGFGSKGAPGRPGETRQCGGL
jgi:hypothetical protein